MEAFAEGERKNEYLSRFALRELVEEWLDRASIERPQDPYEFLIKEVDEQRRSGGGVVTCMNRWCRMTMPASQYAAHQLTCDNGANWVRCIRCSSRVEVTKLSQHRLYCKLERCALCGEMVLPRMLGMCPFRLISEAERDHQAQRRRRERMQLKLEKEGGGGGEATTTPTGGGTRTSSSYGVPAKSREGAEGSFVLDGKRQRLSAKLSLGHSGVQGCAEDGVPSGGSSPATTATASSAKTKEPRELYSKTPRSQRKSAGPSPSGEPLLRPSFPAVAAQDEALRSKLKHFPADLTEKLQSIQRIWRMNRVMHRFRECVFSEVWLSLESSHEATSLSANRSATQLRKVEENFREHLQLPGPCEGLLEGSESSTISTLVEAVSVLQIDEAFLNDPVRVRASPDAEGRFMTASDLEALTRHMVARRVPDLSLAVSVIKAATKMLSSRSVVQRISIPQGGQLIVVGDLHGQLKDLEYLMTLMGPPSANRYYLFNGDFIDRGPYGCEVLIYIFALMCTYPTYVYLNRGNHENCETNMEYGFMSELYAKYAGNASALLDSIGDSYAVMPLISIVDQRVAVVHGGAPRDACTLAEIEAIGHVRDIPVEQQHNRQEQILADLLWNDPVTKFRSRQLGMHHQGDGWRSSKRGCGVEYLENVTEQFLKANNLNLMIRSHDVKMSGFEVIHKGKAVTVFSASNYGGVSGNRGAVAVLVKENLQPTFRTWFAKEDYREEPAFLAESLREAPLALQTAMNNLAAETRDNGGGHAREKPDAAALPSSEIIAPVVKLTDSQVQSFGAQEELLFTGDEFIRAYYVSDHVFQANVEAMEYEGSASSSRASEVDEEALEGLAKTSESTTVVADLTKESLRRGPPAPWKFPSSTAQGAAGVRRRQSPGAHTSICSTSSTSISQNIATVHTGTSLTQDLSIVIQMQTIQVIRELIYFHRYALLAAFTDVDELCTGTVYKAEWCVVLQEELKLDLPWYYLCQYLTPRLEVDGIPSVEYARFLRHFDAAFSQDLRLCWQRSIVQRVFSGLDLPEDLINAFCDVSQRCAINTTAKGQSLTANASVTSNGSTLPSGSITKKPPSRLSRRLQGSSAKTRRSRDGPLSRRAQVESPGAPASLPHGDDTDKDEEEGGPKMRSKKSKHPRLVAIVSPIGVVDDEDLDHEEEGAGDGALEKKTSSLAYKALGKKDGAGSGTSSATATDRGGDADGYMSSDLASSDDDDDDDEDLELTDEDEEDDDWWADVLISFKTFAIQVRTLSPTAATMEDNEIFALFSFFDVEMQGHVFLGDVLDRVMAVLDAMEKDSVEDIELLVSGELDFSSVAGVNHQSGGKSDLSCSSTSSSSSHDEGDASTTMPLKSSPSNALCGSGRLGGGGGGDLRALLRARQAESHQSDPSLHCGPAPAVQDRADQSCDNSLSIDDGTSLRGLKRTLDTKNPLCPGSSEGTGSMRSISRSEAEMHPYSSYDSQEYATQSKALLDATKALLRPPGADDGTDRKDAGDEVIMSANSATLPIPADRTPPPPVSLLTGVVRRSPPTVSIGGVLVRSNAKNSMQSVPVDAPPTAQLSLRRVGSTGSMPSAAAPVETPSSTCSGASSNEAVGRRTLRVDKTFADYANCMKRKSMAPLASVTSAESHVENISFSAPFVEIEGGDKSGIGEASSVSRFFQTSNGGENVFTTPTTAERPSWLYPVLLRVQEQLLGGITRTKQMFFALNQSKDMKLTETEFLPLMEFMNCLLEHPLTAEQAHMVFVHVHDCAIRYVDALRRDTLRGAGDSPSAETPGASSVYPLARYTSTFSQSSSFAYLNNEGPPLNTPASTATAHATWSSGRATVASLSYETRRHRDERREGRSYILLAEFMAFFVVKPVNYEEDQRMMEELLDAGGDTLGGTGVGSVVDPRLPLSGDIPLGSLLDEQSLFLASGAILTPPAALTHRYSACNKSVAKARRTSVVSVENTSSLMLPASAAALGRPRASESLQLGTGVEQLYSALHMPFAAADQVSGAGNANNHVVGPLRSPSGGLQPSPTLLQKHQQQLYALVATLSEAYGGASSLDEVAARLQRGDGGDAVHPLEYASIRQGSVEGAGRHRSGRGSSLPFFDAQEEDPAAVRSGASSVMDGSHLRGELSPPHSQTGPASPPGARLTTPRSSLLASRPANEWAGAATGLFLVPPPPLINAGGSNSLHTPDEVFDGNFSVGSLQNGRQGITGPMAGALAGFTPQQSQQPHLGTLRPGSCGQGRQRQQRRGSPALEHSLLSTSSRPYMLNQPTERRITVVSQAAMPARGMRDAGASGGAIGPRRGRSQNPGKSIGMTSPGSESLMSLRSEQRGAAHKARLRTLTITAPMVGAGPNGAGGGLANPAWDAAEMLSTSVLPGMARAGASVAGGASVPVPSPPLTAGRFQRGQRRMSAMSLEADNVASRSHGVSPFLQPQAPPSVAVVEAGIGGGEGGRTIPKAATTLRSKRQQGRSPSPPSSTTPTAISSTTSPPPPLPRPPTLQRPRDANARSPLLPPAETTSPTTTGVLKRSKQNSPASSSSTPTRHGEGGVRITVPPDEDHPARRSNTSSGGRPARRKKDRTKADRGGVIEVVQRERQDSSQEKMSGTSMNSSNTYGSLILPPVEILVGLPPSDTASAVRTSTETGEHHTGPISPSATTTTTTTTWAASASDTVAPHSFADIPDGMASLATQPFLHPVGGTVHASPAIASTPPPAAPQPPRPPGADKPRGTLTGSPAPQRRTSLTSSSSSLHVGEDGSPLSTRPKHPPRGRHGSSSLTSGSTRPESNGSSAFTSPLGGAAPPPATVKELFLASSPYTASSETTTGVSGRRRSNGSRSMPNPTRPAASPKKGSLKDSARATIPPAPQISSSAPLPLQPRRSGGQGGSSAAAAAAAEQLKHSKPEKPPRVRDGGAVAAVAAAKPAQTPPSSESSDTTATTPSVLLPPTPTVPSTPLGRSNTTARSSVLADEELSFHALPAIPAAAKKQKKAGPKAASAGSGASSSSVQGSTNHSTHRSNSNNNSGNNNVAAAGSTKTTSKTKKKLYDRVKNAASVANAYGLSGGSRR